jgi:hypothetical protein
MPVTPPVTPRRAPPLRLFHRDGRLPDPDQRNRMVAFVDSL